MSLELWSVYDFVFKESFGMIIGSSCHLGPVGMFDSAVRALLCDVLGGRGKGPLLEWF